MKLRAMFLGLAIATIAAAPASADGEGLWPNLAVDAAVVKQQSESIGKQCSERFQSRPDIDCSCFVSKYPEVRLQILSEWLRRWDVAQRAACVGFGGACDAPARVGFQWLLLAKTQKNLPTMEGAPKGGVRGLGIAGMTPEYMFEQVSLKIANVCRNYDYLGTEAEQRCLHNVKSGLLPVKPGKSTKAYCACVKQKIGEQEGEAESLTKCRDI
ncbi:MAG TPA: hypothetical protein VFS58_13785 [Steroidobacteraceae bacterium]|nr:hypothetical protein [Steroidobacteraceae bacterium]